MWSRVVEIMLGCWLIISPFIFGHPTDRVDWWVMDMACGTLVLTFGMLSYWQRTPYAHLLTAAVACAMIVFALTHMGEEVPAAAQNQAVLGLLLAMFAVIPNWSSRPPNSWQQRLEGIGTSLRRGSSDTGGVPREEPHGAGSR